ncbi:MAG: hypothetical protein JNJ60_02720 [Rhodocyclaceae bacterium]|nr:hypothetical protein [Rhodocyclaceae bacterium]
MSALRIARLAVFSLIIAFALASLQHSGKPFVIPVLCAMLAIARDVAGRPQRRQPALQRAGRR